MAATLSILTFGICEGTTPAEARPIDIDALFVPNAMVVRDENIQFGKVGNGHYALKHTGLALFHFASTEWIIDCRQDFCTVQSGPIQATWDAESQVVLSLLEFEGARVSLKRSNRTRNFEIGGGAVLTEVEVFQLRKGGTLIFEENEVVVEAIDLAGFDPVFNFIEWIHNDQETPLLKEHSPLTHLETLQDTANMPRNILVPVTKPQVQFAIRGQNGTPFVP